MDRLSPIVGEGNILHILPFETWTCLWMVKLLTLRCAAGCSLQSAVYCPSPNSHGDVHHELLSTGCYFHFSHWEAARFGFGGRLRCIWCSFCSFIVQALLLQQWGVRLRLRVTMASTLTATQTLTPASAVCRMRHMRVRALCFICLALISRVGRMWPVGWDSGCGLQDAILSTEPDSPQEYNRIGLLNMFYHQHHHHNHHYQLCQLALADDFVRFVLCFYVLPFALCAYQFVPVAS